MEQRRERENYQTRGYLWWAFGAFEFVNAAITEGFEVHG